jgi:hypothetical protein
MKLAKYLFLLLVIMPGIASAQFLFKEVNKEAGIYMIATGASDAGPGVIIVDIDNDGWDDIYMSGGLDSDKLYHNMHDGTFQTILPPNITTHTASDGQWRAFTRGGIAFDYDNDGFTDLYLVCLNHDFLWHNNGDGTFTNTTRTANLNFPLDANQSMTATFGDIDGDGDNDFYVARWVELSKFSEDNTNYAHKGFPNWMYMNNGNGTFTERAVEMHIDGDTGTTNIALLFDYDRDGDLDLLIGNDFGVTLTPNQVFKNMLMETGEATFVDVTKDIGMESHLFCMGIGPSDYNRDGNFDFYETTFGTDSMMMNNGDGTFKGVRDRVLPHGNGFERSGTGFMTTSWTALSGDFDNDGWEDYFIVHGFEGAIPPWLTNPNQLDTSLFYHNFGGRFEDYTDKAMDEKYFDFRMRGAASFDYNHDGKLDFCIASQGFNSPVEPQDFRIIKNISTSSFENNTHWLEMRFTAKRTAKEGIGTIVDVWAGGERHSRQVSTGGGFGSQNSLTQHVGLGEYPIADSIVIYWPADKNRHRQIDRYLNVKADTILNYVENTAADVAPVPSKQTAVIYPSPVNSVLNVKNLEGTGQKHFEIYDLLGIKHLDITGNESTFTLSVGNLKSGCYVLRITVNGNVITKQFIKN